MLMYWDAVLNHRTGADNKEKVTVREVSKTGESSDWLFTSPLY